MGLLYHVINIRYIMDLGELIFLKHFSCFTILGIIAIHRLFPTMLGKTKIV